MANLLVRGLDERTVEQLKKRAELAGRSLQSETKRILEEAAGRTLGESLKAAAGWRKKLGKRSTDCVDSLREDRER